MILALLNGRAGAGKTTLAVHLAAEWASKHERLVLIDADQRRDALRWHEARIRSGLPPRFRVLPAEPERLDRRALERLVHRSGSVIIDGPSGDAALSMPALLACDLVVIPTQASPADTSAALEMIALVMDARWCRPGLPIRFAFNRRGATSNPARETAEMRVEYEPALLDSVVGQHPAYAVAMRSGRLVHDLDVDTNVVRELAALAAEIRTMPIPDRPAASFADSILPRLVSPWIAQALRLRKNRCASDAAVADAPAPHSSVVLPAGGERS